MWHVLYGHKHRGKLRPPANVAASWILPGNVCFLLGDFPSLKRLSRASVTLYRGCARNPGLSTQWQASSAGPKQLSRVEDGQSREAVDKQRLLHWRRELAELVSEAGLPIAAQAQLASAPEEIIVASLGAMRASTIRKKVREWRKLRNFAWVLVDVPGLRT